MKIWSYGQLIIINFYEKIIKYSVFGNGFDVECFRAAVGEFGGLGLPPRGAVDQEILARWMEVNPYLPQRDANNNYVFIISNDDLMAALTHLKLLEILDFPEQPLGDEGASELPTPGNEDPLAELIEPSDLPQRDADGFAGNYYTNTNSDSIDELKTKLLDLLKKIIQSFSMYRRELNMFNRELEALGLSIIDLSEGEDYIISRLLNESNRENFFRNALSYTFSQVTTFTSPSSRKISCAFVILFFYNVIVDEKIVLLNDELISELPWYRRLPVLAVKATAIKVLSKIIKGYYESISKALKDSNDTLRSFKNPDDSLNDYNNTKS